MCINSVPYCTVRSRFNCRRLVTQCNIRFFRHLLIDLSPRTDDRIRWCTNGEKIPSKVFLPEEFKHLKHLCDEHTKSIYSFFKEKFFKTFPPHGKFNFYELFQMILSDSSAIHRQPAARKLVGTKMKPHAQIQKLNSRTIFEKDYLEAKKKSIFVAKGFAAHENHFPICH